MRKGLALKVANQLSSEVNEMDVGINEDSLLIVFVSTAIKLKLGYIDMQRTPR